MTSCRYRPCRSVSPPHLFLIWSRIDFLPYRCDWTSRPPDNLSAITKNTRVCSAPAIGEFRSRRASRGRTLDDVNHLSPPHPSFVAVHCFPCSSVSILIPQLSITIDSSVDMWLGIDSIVTVPITVVASTSLRFHPSVSVAVSTGFQKNNRARTGSRFSIFCYFGYWNA